jgi:nitroreductase
MGTRVTETVTDTALDGATMDAGELVAGLAGHRHAPARDGLAPSTAQVDELIAAAAAVPDHNYLRPFRFAVITGAGRDRLAVALAADLIALQGRGADEARDRAESKAYAAPCLVAVIASPNLEATIPLWEQVASASCCGYAIVLQAQALGLGAIWKSPPVREGAAFAAFFDLADHEQLLGWVLVGSRPEVERPSRREAPDVADLQVTIA